MKSIRTRVLRVFLPFALIAVCLTWLSVELITDRLVHAWASNFVHTEADHALEHTVEPLIGELALAKSLSRSPEVIAWAQDPDDQLKRETALAFLNNYRLKFSSDNYFIALRENGHYYQNDREGTGGAEYKYSLSRDIADDSWFFNLIDANPDQNINVNYDRVLDVTQLWINIPIRSEGEVLGLVGTGVDLGEFIEHKVTHAEDRETLLFVDSKGVIQLAPDSSKIVLGSAASLANDSTTIFDYLEVEGHKTELLQAMEAARNSPSKEPNVDLIWEGKEYLVGVVYISMLDWYQLIFIDITAILPISDFYPLFMVFVVATVLLLVIVFHGLREFILRPLKKLRDDTEQFRLTREFGEPVQQRTREFSDLYSAFGQMVEEIRSNEAKLENELEKRTRELIQAERMASLGTIAAGVAHEINNPLSYLLSNIALVRDYTRSVEPHLRARLEQLRLEQGSQSEAKEIEFILEDLEDLIEDARNGCERIRQVVGGLQQYSHLDTGLPQSFSVNDLVSLAVDLVREKIPAGFHIEVDRIPDLPQVRVDPKAMAQIVSNLIGNAVDACEGQPDAEVRVATGYEGGRVRVRVIDNGTGMSGEVMEKLFTPFFTTKPVGSGQGLSLAVAQAVVKSAGGNILVTSEAGKGSTFEIELRPDTQSFDSMEEGRLNEP